MQVYRNNVDGLNEEHVSSESDTVLWKHCGVIFYNAHVVYCGLFIVGSSMVNPP